MVALKWLQQKLQLQRDLIQEAQMYIEKKEEGYASTKYPIANFDEEAAEMIAGKKVGVEKSAENSKGEAEKDEMEKGKGKVKDRPTIQKRHVFDTAAQFARSELKLQPGHFLSCSHTASCLLLGTYLGDHGTSVRKSSRKHIQIKELCHGRQAQNRSTMKSVI